MVINMDIGKIISDSAEFTRDAVWGRWVRWVMLVISTIIFPLLFGYMMEIYRGNPTPPECTNWIARFIDGLKLIVASFIYSIPLLIVLIITFLPVISEFFNQITMEGDIDYAVFEPFILPVLIGIIITCILGLIIFLISTIGIIRMARMNRFMEAFNISGILTTIRSIGWINYIIGLIVLYVIAMVLGVVINLIMEVHLIGLIIGLFLYPVLIIFESRYVTILYETSGE